MKINHKVIIIYHFEFFQKFIQKIVNNCYFKFIFILYSNILYKKYSKYNDSLHFI